MASYNIRQNSEAINQLFSYQIQYNGGLVNYLVTTIIKTFIAHYLTLYAYPKSLCQYKVSNGLLKKYLTKVKDIAKIMLHVIIRSHGRVYIIMGMISWTMANHLFTVCTYEVLLYSTSTQRLFQ